MRGSVRETILVVDDAEAIRNMVCVMLSHKGYSCLQASDGTEALQLLEGSGDVHLVLTDMMMPRMNGHELARRIVRLRPDVRILFMSGCIEDPAVRGVVESSVFLPKPFTPAVLTEKVRQVLDRPWWGLPETSDASPQ